jgi:predicted DNA-binding protein
MSVKTIRFNKKEESMLKKILSHYATDFSTCVKELIAEKLEDLQDIGFLQRLKEGRPGDYLSASQISAFFKR